MFRLFLVMKVLLSLVTGQSLLIFNGLSIKGSEFKIQTLVNAFSTIPLRNPISIMVNTKKYNRDDNYVLKKLKCENTYINYVESNIISYEVESLSVGAVQESMIHDTKNSQISNDLVTQHASTFPILFLFPLLDSYAAILQYAPLPTKMISSFILGGLCDIITQKLEIKALKHSQFDYRRLLVFSCVSGFYTAPIIHVWFHILPQLPVIEQLDGIAKALVMVLIDQTFGAVVVTVGIFFAFEAVS